MKAVKPRAMLCSVPAELCKFVEDMKERMCGLRAEAGFEVLFGHFGPLHSFCICWHCFSVLCRQSAGQAALFSSYNGCMQGKEVSFFSSCATCVFTGWLFAPLSLHRQVLLRNLAW